MEMMVQCDCENMLDVSRWLILSAAQETVAIIWNQLNQSKKKKDEFRWFTFNGEYRPNLSL